MAAGAAGLATAGEAGTDDMIAATGGATAEATVGGVSAFTGEGIEEISEALDVAPKGDGGAAIVIVEVGRAIEGVPPIEVAFMTPALWHDIANCEQTTASKVEATATFDMIFPSGRRFD